MTWLAWGALALVIVFASNHVTAPSDPDDSPAWLLVVVVWNLFISACVLVPYTVGLRALLESR